MTGIVGQARGEVVFEGRAETISNSNNLTKLVPEGIEGRVPYRGPLRNIVHQLVGGLRDRKSVV
mgnify:CR=1 FL=1